MVFGHFAASSDYPRSLTLTPDFYCLQYEKLGKRFPTTNNRGSSASNSMPSHVVIS